METLPREGAPYRVAVDIQAFLRRAQDCPTAGEFDADEHPLAPSPLDGDLSDLTELPNSTDSSGTSDDGSEREEVRTSRRRIRPLPAFPPTRQPRIHAVSPTLPATTGHTATPPQADESSQNRKQRKRKSPEKVRQRNLQKRVKREGKREEERDRNGGLKGVTLKRMQEAQPLVVRGFDAARLPAAQGAWVGMRQRFKPTVRTLEALKAANIEILEWRDEATHPVLDEHGRAFILMSAPPRCDDWPRLQERIAQKISKARKRAKFTEKQTRHARGPFPVMAGGYGHGGGTTVSFLLVFDPASLTST